MNRRLACGIVTCLGLVPCAPALANPAGAPDRQRIPRFEDFPAGPAVTRTNRLLLRNAEDRLYRTRLGIAARQKPDFAGHYIVARWGCGAICQSVAVMDVQSGRVTWAPGTICCWDNDVDEPVQYRIDSRLLVLTGLRNEKEDDNGVHYYRIEGSRLVHLKDIWTTAHD